MKLPSVPNAELLSVREEGEWMTVEMAVDSKLAPPFGVHKSDWRQFNAVELERFLARQALSMVSMYGDVREGRTDGASA